MTNEKNARVPRQETPAHARFDLDEVIEHGSTAATFALAAGLVLSVWLLFYAVARVYTAVAA